MTLPSEGAFPIVTSVEMYYLKERCPDTARLASGNEAKVRSCDAGSECWQERIVGEKENLPPHTSQHR